MTTPITESIFCPAKINLHLEVLDKRPDGYHDLDTVMQSVTLCDRVSVTVSESNCTENTVNVTCNRDDVPSAADSLDNIAAKAARSYLAEAAAVLRNPAFYHVEIGIEKVIPVSAGLAGGSTDAAGVLLLLDQIFDHAIPFEKLLQIGKALGADVPFCMTGGCKRCRGIGDEMTNAPPLSTELFLCIAKGKEGVSTAGAYEKMDARTCEKKSADRLVSALEREDLVEIGELLYNAFESVTGTKETYFAENVMKNCGAVGALMSGSGPSVFGIFVSIDDAQSAYDRLIANGFDAHLCSPIR